MHRKPLLQQLIAYEQAWPAEADTARRLIGFVEAHAECFERHLQPGHVTGSAWVVNPAQTHVLLTHHRKLGKWLQLGGHADGNPDMLDAALREVQEESGLKAFRPVSRNIFDIDIHLIPERKNESAHHHYDIRYAVQAVGSEAYVVSDESHDLAWVEIQTLQQVTGEESMLRMAKKWLAR
jgi:8-oxo-dGTP pyrophosphatase MutT (NUDIX family)